MLSLENGNDRTGHTGCYLPKVEINDHNVKIDGRNFLINQYMMKLKHQNIRKISTGQGDD